MAQTHRFGSPRDHTRDRLPRAACNEPPRMFSSFGSDVLRIVVSSWGAGAVGQSGLGRGLRLHGGVPRLPYQDTA